MRSGRIRPNERTDWLLSAELALAGPIPHIHELLAHRGGRDWKARIDRAAFRRRLDPAHGERLRTSATDLSRELYALARSANLSAPQLRRCRRALARFWAQEVKRTSRMRLRDAMLHLARR
jgi:hypothetical protein